MLCNLTRQGGLSALAGPSKAVTGEQLIAFLYGQDNRVSGAYLY